METHIVKTVAAVDDTRHDMLTGVLLHQIKPAVIVKDAFCHAARFQRFFTQMDDLLLPLLHIQHPNAVQRTQIAGLSAALGVKGGGVQPNLIPFRRFLAGDHLGLEPVYVAIFIIEFSCHGLPPHVCFAYFITIPVPLQRCRPRRFRRIGCIFSCIVVY